MERLKLQVGQERWKAEQERKAYAEGDAYEEEQFKVRQNALSKLDVPKFKNKFLKSVVKYLQLFESVLKQNGYSEDTWPLALRTAVVGTGLQNIAACAGSYAEIKHEKLFTEGQTLYQIWHELISIQ